VKKLLEAAAAFFALAVIVLAEPAGNWLVTATQASPSLRPLLMIGVGVLLLGAAIFAVRGLTSQPAAK
jgi:hypothetical protein